MMREGSVPLQVGDVFRLQYGSPKMTVIDIDGEGANCVWLAGSGEQTAWVSFACPMKIGKRSSSQESTAGAAPVSPAWIARIQAFLKQFYVSVQAPLYSLVTYVSRPGSRFRSRTRQAKTTLLTQD
jgi:uncharacterized protein YodC (DUF2158 family)